MIIPRPGINCCAVLDHLEKKCARRVLAASLNPSHKIVLFGKCPILGSSVKKTNENQAGVHGRLATSANEWMDKHRGARLKLQLVSVAALLNN
jgi:hypothetical protein